MVLDLSLPRLGGLDVLRSVRGGNAGRSDTPIIVLSGRSGEEDRIVGLDLGADDYLVKPFSPGEPRRGSGRCCAAACTELTGEAIIVGRLRIEPASRRVLRDEEEVELTPEGVRPAGLPAAHPRHVFSRSQLVDQVWNSSSEWLGEATVTEHVHRLRLKLEEDPSRPRILRTVRGVGYQLWTASEQPDATAARPDLRAGRPTTPASLLDRQTEVLELIAGAAPLPDVLAGIVGSLEHLMPGARCSVLLLDRERRTLHHGAAPSLPGDYVAAIDGMPIGEAAGSCGTAATLNVAVVARDVLTDTRWADYRGLATAAGLRSCWSTPIEGRDGLPVGTFAVYHSRPHRPNRREQLLVDRFTHLASVAIGHAGPWDLLESEERAGATNSLGMAISGSTASSSRATTPYWPWHWETALTAFLADVVTPKGRSLGERLDELDRHGAAPSAFEAALHRAGLSDVEVEVTVSLLRARDGSPAQYVVNVFDLTERRAAEQDRRARLDAETARRTAEQLSHAKSELLATVGHEARTPIQAIVGFAELLGTIDLDEARRREALDHIGAAAGHVMDLLADVLDLSRIEANALPLALEPVRVREVVAEVFGLLSDQARQRASHPGAPRRRRDRASRPTAAAPGPAQPGRQLPAPRPLGRPRGGRCGPAPAGADPRRHRGRRARHPRRPVAAHLHALRPRRGQRDRGEHRARPRARPGAGAARAGRPWATPPGGTAMHLCLRDAGSRPALTELSSPRSPPSR